MSLVIQVLVNAAALFVAARLSSDISLGGGSTTSAIVNVIGVGALLTAVNMVVRPIIKALTMPFYFLTLGLFSFVVTALMLTLVSWLSGVVGLSFTLGSFFFSTLIAAVIVTVVSMVLTLVLPDGSKR